MAVLGLNLLTGGNASPARLIAPPGEQPVHQAQARDVEVTASDSEGADLAKRKSPNTNHALALTDIQFR
jgi:hypothetical protein